MSVEPHWHRLFDAEANLSRQRLEQLRGLNLLPQLLRLIDEGGVTTRMMPELYEVRVAGMLIDNGHTFIYEFDAGVGGSTIDFGIPRETPTVLMEVVSIQESAIVTAGTAINADYPEVTEVMLRSDAADQRLTSAGEIIKIQEKLGEKAFRNGAETKFPAITDRTQVILCDVRGYAGGEGPLPEEIYQLMYGSKQLNGTPLEPFMLQFGDLPVSGIFDPENMRAYAVQLRERVHGIGFSIESTFEINELQEQIRWFPNPFIPDSEDRLFALGFGTVRFLKGNEDPRYVSWRSK